jgi:tetratricopeptide (TPR) repeat protein
MFALNPFYTSLFSLSRLRMTRKPWHLLVPWGQRRKKEVMQEYARRLRRERGLHSWSQEQVAEKIGTTAPNVSRWERGKTFPDTYFRQKLCELFGKSAEELDFQKGDDKRREQSLSQAFDNQNITNPILTASTSLWNIPYRRNPFFTGREDVLTRLHDVLKSGKAAALTQAQAISGLGGIGKTQTSLEYAYRYRRDYQTVLWAKADTRETLVSDFVAIAGLLNLPEKDEQYQNRIVAAVKRWLEDHTKWLLILDNVEDFTIISDFVPVTGKGQCHMLLTTRTQVTGALARRIDLEKMEPEEGALFLLRRAKLIPPDALLKDASDADRIKAKEISLVLDGLPLALDQAGAYIEETACRLSDYLSHYQTRRNLLLNMRGGPVADHPETVTTTFSLSFEKVERVNPAAAELLQFCAFLHPDAIPEEIITDGDPRLGSYLQSIAADSFKLDAAISELRKFSLLRRNPDTRMLTIHRLVQDVLKDGMDENTQRHWAERTVRAVNQAFPEVEFATWQRCQRCLPHSQTCASLIEQWRLAFAEAARLLDHTGAYLLEYARYSQAEQFHQQALAIREQILGREHPDVATSLMHLAKIYHYQGNYPRAEPIFQRALTIYEQVLGPEHPDVAYCINFLGELYYSQGKFDLAESLWMRALDIRKRFLGPENTLISECLNNLGILYHYQDKYAQGERLLTQALTMGERTIGPEHPEQAYIIDNLARLYRDTGKYAQAEVLFQQALALRERTLGLNHPLVAESLSDWARLCYHQGKYVQGELLCQRALTIWEQTIGTEHPRIAQTFNNLALLFHAQGKYAQAELLYERSLNIREQTLGPEHPKVAQTLNNLAMNGLAKLRYSRGEYTCAEPLFQRALAIREKVLGSEHPEVAESLNDLARLYYAQRKYAQAEALYQRALAIREQSLRPDHPDVAMVLKNYAILLVATERKDEAVKLSARAKAIRAKHTQQNMQPGVDPLYP